MRSAIEHSAAMSPAAIGPLPPARGPRVRLVVAEKPSVARDLATFLGLRERCGPAYVGDTLWVVPCIGHMAELAPPEHYTGRWRAWRMDALPMLPSDFSLVVARRNEAHWHVLKAWLRHKRVTGLVNACDAGREGELIFRFVYELAGCTQPCERLWLQALTAPAVQRAFAKLQPAAHFDGLAAAARCRAEADWLVGLNGTRALTLHGRRKDAANAPLCSVGRVQTPTLAMLVAREQAIEEFRAEPYWEVSAHVAQAPDVVFRAVAPAAERFAARTPDAPAAGPATPTAWAAHRFAAEATARRVADAITLGDAKVSAFSAKEEEIAPPACYDLTALQREANTRFGMRAADTLAAAQTLYESDKAITYPRTDSRYLPSTLGPNVSTLVTRLSQGPEGALARRVQATLNRHAVGRLLNDDAVSDHHAIVPTGQAPRSGPQSAPGRIYQLVLRRFLAALSPPAKAGVSQLCILAQGIELIARGRSLIVAGWQAIDPPPRRADDAPALPALREKMFVSVRDAKLHRLQTRPPPRLSEATLLLAMERAGRGKKAAVVAEGMRAGGLGTPATRAAIIETLKQRGYIRNEGRSLMPTAAGRALCAALPSEDLKSAALTSAWEARLAKVAQGTETREAFMRDIDRFVRTFVADIARATPPPTRITPDAGPSPRAPRPPPAPPTLQ